VAFKLDPSGHETVLHAFTGGIDGGYPNGSLTLDKAGNLYGAASAGGDLSACSGSGCGVVFKLDRSGNETVLYSFTGGADGISPNGAFIFDNAGSLYGTAAFGGGAGNVGTAFKLDKFGNLIVLHMFTGGADGGDPQGGLIFDPEGSLYGTAYVDGAHGAGVVFKISTY
jgi:uncharacterized repeat protein (TIGR03803 family)